MRLPYTSEYPQCSWCVSSLSAPSNDCIAVVASCLQICLVSVTRGCWIEAPEKKTRSKLKFSNTENGDVCRCVCLWWFRNKFPISGCMFSSVFVNASPCLCTRVCVSAYMHSGVRREQSSAAFCCSVILVWLAFRLLFESAGSAEPSHPGNNQHPGKDRGSDLKEKDEAQWEGRKRKKERQQVKMRKWKRVSSSQKLKV